MGGMRDGGGEKTRKPGGNSTSGAAPPRGGDVWYSDVGRAESNALQSLGLSYQIHLSGQIILYRDKS